MNGEEKVAAFWKFVAERQRMLHRRNSGQEPPWTLDPILAGHRFTNVYRASDRVSQYLINKVQYNRPWSADDLVFRTILFRLYNRIETWEMLDSSVGASPCLENWDAGRYSIYMDRWVATGKQLWTSAYMVTPPAFAYDQPKHYAWNVILDQIVDGGITRILQAQSTQEIFRLLRTYNTVGDFFAWQWTVDINYSAATPIDIAFSEDTYVVPGPGAKRGIHKLFGGGVKPVDAVYDLARSQVDHLPSSFPYLGGVRLLSMMDIQNCLCEFDKYSRVAYPELQSDTGYYNKIKQKYNPARATEPLHYGYPPKWNIPETAANTWLVQEGENDAD